MEEFNGFGLILSDPVAGAVCQSQLIAGSSYAGAGLQIPLVQLSRGNGGVAGSLEELARGSFILCYAVSFGVKESQAHATAEVVVIAALAVKVDGLGCIFSAETTLFIVASHFGAGPGWVFIAGLLQELIGSKGIFGRTVASAIAAGQVGAFAGVAQIAGLLFVTEGKCRIFRPVPTVAVYACQSAAACGVAGIAGLLEEMDGALMSGGRLCRSCIERPGDRNFSSRRYRTPPGAPGGFWIGWAAGWLVTRGSQRTVATVRLRGGPDSAWCVSPDWLDQMK